MIEQELTAAARQTPPLSTAQALIDIKSLQAQLDQGGNAIKLFREAIKQAEKILDERFRDKQNIVAIVNDRAYLIDEILKAAWAQFDWPDNKHICLVAVGGYGRGELHPLSDIDLLILTRRSRNERYSSCISEFLTFLWDIGLEVGQSVRSKSQCKQEAIKDITVATALMESRCLIGPVELHQAMLKTTSTKRVWPIKSFLRAKWDEQIARHKKYHDIDYALEPNLKTSPGGLRDIQTIAWVAKRQFDAKSFADLVQLGFLKPSEHILLSEGQQFLWTLRYGLHLLSKRREDRLLFDKQRQLATLLGYVDDEKSLAVEKLMQKYYRTVATLRALNDVLLQHLDEAILRAGEREQITPINRRFQIHNDYIEVCDARVFQHSPYALLEIFVLMAQHEQIQGVRASTIRLLNENRHLIDDEFRGDIRNISLFMELLRSPFQMAKQLRRMARYGILELYLPEFGKITGQMQHDMFHIYTVDAHTLQVVENMRGFRLPGAEEKFPVSAHIIKTLPKPELLYIAGLYHDIAKGRGGDHSTLGMVDAEEFCVRHRLSDWDMKLVSWIVGKHLLMSMTAQRMDISDPDVIRDFALVVGDKLHLDYLYLMTVADICATNPNLWNSWRASLMRQLYLNTKRALRLGLENPVNRADRIKDKQLSAMTKLIDKGMSKQRIEQLWGNFGEEYFLRESTANIVWHTDVLNTHSDGPLISVKEIHEHTIEGATQIFIYAKNTPFLFVNSACAFDKLELNIQGARIFTCNNNYCMDTYTVLEKDGTPIGDKPERIGQINEVLIEHLAISHMAKPASNVHRPRKLKSLSQHITTQFVNTEGKPYSTLELNAPDQPGILACVGQIFAENEITLWDARITTLGERIEDLFFITDSHDLAITDSSVIDKLQQEINTRLKEKLAN